MSPTTPPDPSSPTPAAETPIDQSTAPVLPTSPAPDAAASPAPSPAAPTPNAPLSPGGNPINEVFDSQTPQPVEINSNTGGFTYGYPIAIPPGRNNLQPDVKLIYMTDNTELRNIFGEGWLMGIPYIQRESKYGVDHLYSPTSSPFFLSSIDGELATTTVTSVYTARVDNGNFRSYTTSSNQWLVKDKNGTQYKFGSSTSTRMDDPNNSANVFKWMLQEVRDTNDNYIKYTYYKDGGQIYPSSIIYTGNGVTDGIFEIDFLRESRTDVATSSQFGFAVTTNSRINEIDVKSNGTLVHKYALAYIAGANGATSLLSSITETGYDESSNAITLPATSFTYKSSTPGWKSDSNWIVPTVPLEYNGFEQGYRIIDVNGDGLPDVMRSFATTPGPNYTYTSLINNGHNWTQDDNWNLPVQLFWNGSDMGYQLIDVNGDHLPDIVYANFQSATTTYATYINNGHGWTLDDSWDLPTYITENAASIGARFVDVNGDGLVDLLIHFDGTSGAYINNGHGWTRDDTWLVSVQFFVSSADQGYRITDVNGDGLPDIMRSFATTPGPNYTYTSLINNGHGWSQDDNWNLPVQLFWNGYDQGYQLLDINGDHMADIVYGNLASSEYTYTAYINNGHGWTLDSNWNLPTYLTVNTAARGVKFADVDGDGMVDLVLKIDSDPGGGYDMTYTANGQIIDQLTEITHPAGGKTDIQYKQVAGYFDGSNNLTNTSVPFFLNTVYKVSTSDGTTTSTLDTFAYKGGKFQYYTPFDKKFAAFAEVDKTDNAGNVTKTFYHTGSGNDSAHGEFQDNYWKIGKFYRVEKYDGNSILFQKSINKWDVATSTELVGFVKLAQTETLDFDGQSTHKDKAESYSYSNTTGDITQKVEYGQVSGSDDGTFADSGTDKFASDYTYATSTTSVIMSALDHVTVTDQSSNKAKEAKYFYDNLAFGGVDKGNQTEKDDWKTSTSYIISKKAYNSYGLVATSTDPRGKVTTYVYDSYNLYPATTTRPLSLVTQATYNYPTGKVDRTTDENGNKFLNTYDGLGRLTLAQQPDPSATSSLLTKTAYAYNDTTGTIYVHQTDYLSSASTVDSYTYYDGLKRSTQTRKAAEFGKYETKDFAYNNISLLQQESLPYFSSGASSTAATTVQALFTTYAYDALQRTVTSANVLGTTTRAYVNWKTTITDANGKTKDLLNDAYGNLIEVDEHNASATYTTTYVYNGLNALTSLTDALGNVRNFTYDGLGRRLAAQDLHGSGDATFGSWSYTYDDAGNLTQVLDPKNQTINRTYDDVNRVLNEDYTGQAGTEVSYIYDSCAQGIGRLCTASSSAVTANNTYNALGQLTQESKTISGTSTAFVTSYTYDRQGNQLTITNPDNSQVQYAYNRGGRTETVQRKESTDSSFADVVTNFDYSPTGKVAFQDNGNCTQTTNTYDPAKLYRLTNKLTTNPCQQQGMGMMSMFAPIDYGAALTSPASISTSSPLPEQSSVLGWNSKTEISNGGAGRRSEFHTKQINFKDADGAFKPINVTPVPTAGGWEVAQNTFIARFPSRSTGQADMVNNNRFDTRTLTDITEPIQTMTITASGVADVAGVLEYGDVGYGAEWYVRYPQAYPVQNADLIYLAWHGKVPRLQKLVRFNSALASDTDFRFSLVYPDKDPDFIQSTGATWDKASILSTNRSVRVGKAGDKRGFGMKSFMMWDMTPPGKKKYRKFQAINVSLEKAISSNSYVLTKHVPASFFSGVTFPVYTDSSITVYPEADPETSTVDGRVGDGAIDTFQNVRNASGNLATDNAATVQWTTGVIYEQTLKITVNRAIFLFNTNIGGGTVTSATLSLYGSSKEDDTPNQINPDINVYSSSPTSNTSLVASDYTQTASTAFSTAIGYGSWSTTGYNDFSLNANGLTNINLAGISKFAARNANYDVAGITPSWSSNTAHGLYMYFAEQTGTSSDPVLTVQWFSVAPIAPTSLLTEGQTNPIGVSDLTPEFSAIYNDPDATDTAPFYQVQVSTSSTSWSSLMWDSGKTAMATTTQGTRSPDISYAGSPLAPDGSTYYWRIKFWDGAGNAGSYSTSTASFTMLNDHTPTGPTSLLTEGQTNPTAVIDLTPEFSAIYNDADATDTAPFYQLQVSPSSTSWSSLMWDSGKTAMATTTQGTRSPDISYAGLPLALNASTYYWRIAFWDNQGIQGTFSTSTASFTMGNQGVVIQSISYAYDAVGNITQIINSSPTNAASTASYIYDDLYRITSASVSGTPAGISSYTQTYSYDALGNMLNKSDQGAYVYATSSTVGYANPDAAISIAGGNVNYDNNGNVISASSTTSSGWSVNGGTWNRRIPITINHTKVSGASNLINFPLLVSTSSTEFKTVSNGGYVASSTGADIFFTASDGQTKLNHELENYTAATGTVIAWVQVPTIATSVDTVIYMYYGNASSGDQQNKTAAWDSNYAGVWHLPNGTTLTANDSTGNGNNGSVSSASATSGKIFGAANFNGSTSTYISVADSSTLKITSAVTLSGWLYLNAATFASYTGLIRKGSTANYYPNNYMVQGIAGTRLLQLVYAHAANNNDWINSSGSVAANGWTYITGVIDTQNNFRGIYLNGVLDTSTTVSAEAMSTSTDPVWLGKRADAGLKGNLDEVRISKAARSAGWIKTEYNNETSSTFFTLGTASSNTYYLTRTTKITWDYLNRITQDVYGGATSTYAYDPWGQRVKTIVATSTTATSYYPTKLYNIVTTGKPTKHIFANGEIVATVIGSGTATTVSFIHTDHLAGSNVITDSGGNIGELLDNFPYGSSRLDQQTSFNEQRKFIGQEFDAATQLSYLNARYYDGAKGKFISQDSAARDNLGKFLPDPQQLNFYSYARNNPLIFVDETGKSSLLAWALNPLGTAAQVGFWGIGASLLGQSRPLSAQLMARSLTVNPGNLVITPGNQGKYSNAIDQIKGSPDYQTRVNELLSNAESKGSNQISRPGGLETGIAFDLKSDLGTSIGKASISSFDATKGKDGSWNVIMTLSDTYNYEFSKSYGDSSSRQAFNTLNNLAVGSQAAGAISQYKIDIQLSDTIKKLKR